MRKSNRHLTCSAIVVLAALLAACNATGSDGTRANDSSEPNARSELPVIGDGQLREPSLLTLANTMGVLSVVEAEVVKHSDVPVGVPYRTESGERTVCTLKVSRTLVGPEADTVLVGCSFPDRVVPEDDAAMYRKAKEEGLLGGDDSDPAAVSLLPKDPWPIGTISAFIISPLVGAPADLPETASATPVLWDEATGAVTLSPKHLTRSEYPSFGEDLTIGVADLVELNRLFIESKGERDAANQAAIDEIEARWPQTGK